MRKIRGFSKTLKNIDDIYIYGNKICEQNKKKFMLYIDFLL